VKRSLALILVAIAVGRGAEPTARAPNVLLIVSDNQPADTIRALGNTYIETPHLDRIVREGSVFTRAITANPHCIPSRAEIISGASGFANGSRPFGRGLDPALPLWPQVMRAAGYHTWHVGKWDTDGTPRSRGYEETRALLTGGGAGNRAVSHPTMRNGRPATGYRGYTFKTDDNRPEPEKGVGLTPMTDRYIADGAIDFITRRTPEPFFLHVNFAGCHDPLLPGPGFENKYEPSGIPLPRNFLPSHSFDWGNAGGRDELLLPSPLAPEDVKQELADLYAVISHLDSQIGRVLDALRKNGAYDKTIVIFTTDNGAGVGRHGIRGYQNMYEHAISVPLIMRGPGIPAGARFAAQCYLRDLYPTVCDLVGIVAPATVEGRSLVPVLSGRAREIYPEVYGYWHNPAKTGPFPIERMIRTDRWKLIYYSHLDRHQLFDLENDPLELRDYSADPAHASVRAELQQKLDAWFRPRIATLAATSESRSAQPGKN
jgi:arylsulfatase A-like enzyme